jgi:predicted  nucleic acid-binding Zn-ribbon protein
MPDPSPNGQASARGADDTYLFGGSPGRTGTLNKTPAIPETSTGSDPNEPTDSGADINESNETSTVSDVLSSPVADAMARNVNRAVSSGMRKNEVSNPNASDRSHTQQSENAANDDDNNVSFGTSSGQGDGSDPSVSDSVDKFPETTPVRRPAFLQNRSQRSSVSSVATDNTLGADFAIQSGGAVATNGQGRSQLSRLSSLGSVSSLRSGYSDGIPEFSRTRSSTSGTNMAIDTALGRLEEEGPATPRAGTHNKIAPSDTVIARHIRDIHVPETVAREYRAKHSTTRSPERRKAIGMSVSTRSSKNLTLKDTNDKIDKLSKENFDLKLKLHFLDQTLQLRSNEGVKEIIDQNVQLQMDLANAHKESQTLRRKVRELERKLKAKDEQAEKTQDDDDDHSSGDEEKAEMEEEIIYLRETVQHLQSESERLKSDNMSKELEKRKLAEYVKTMSDRKPSGSSAIEEKDEMWKELVEAETARREAADEDVETLREENRRLKNELASSNQTNVRNVYNISKRNTIHSTRSEMGQSDVGHNGDANGVDSQASTVVNQLQTEKADLRRENAELRRDLSAQTSMLTSRNKERERLQQEIEDLKIQSRRGGMDSARSMAGDSIFDRSVSRAHQRSSSRASGITRVTQVSDPERDEIEKKANAIRDELAQVKMLNQDLENALNEQLDTVEVLESDVERLRNEGELALDDLQQLQQERDDLLMSIQDKDNEFETLRAQAVENIDKLEEELDQKEADFNTIQSELKSMSESVVMLEDELNASRRKEESLSQQLEEAEREIEQLEQKVQDISSKNERLEVQLESSQNEVSFLREEQEGDKIKIGELEASINAAQTQIEDMAAQAALERRQRDALDSEEKAQIQAAMDELNSQSTSGRDEIRKLRKKLGDKENEADAWRERLETLETNLREALGDLNGTRSSILKVSEVTNQIDCTSVNISFRMLLNFNVTLSTRFLLLKSLDKIWLRRKGRCVRAMLS